MVEDLVEMNRRFVEVNVNTEETERELRKIQKKLTTVEQHLEEAMEVTDKLIADEVQSENDLTYSEHQQNEKEQQ